MLVASLVSVILAPARTAPVGSATRPTMRPLAPCADSRVRVRTEITTKTQEQRAVQRGRSDSMEPPDISGRVCFSWKATACIRPQPCYNPARLENGHGG